MRADLADQRQNPRLELSGGQKRLLGDLQHETARLSALRQPLQKSAHEARVAGELGGDVEAKLRLGSEG